MQGGSIRGRLLRLLSFRAVYNKAKPPESDLPPRWTPQTQPASITVQSDSPRGGRTTLSTTSPRAPHPQRPRPPFSASTAFPTSGALQFPPPLPKFLIHTVTVTRCRFGWRYQIGPWVRAGYRVVVPDMLGYGGTDKPWAAEEYSTRRLCADLAALLDVIGVQKAVSVIAIPCCRSAPSSHAAPHVMAMLACCTDRDRARLGLVHCGTVRIVAPRQAVGAGAVSPVRLFPIRRAELTGAFTRFSIPYSPPVKKYIPLEGVVEKVPNFAYQLYFASPESTKEIEANVRNVIFELSVPSIR